MEGDLGLGAALAHQHARLHAAGAADHAGAGAVTAVAGTLCGDQHQHEEDESEQGTHQEDREHDLAAQILDGLHLARLARDDHRRHAGVSVLVGRGIGHGLFLLAGWDRV